MIISRPARRGYTNPVVALENGTMGWLLAGFALERDAGRVAPVPSAGGRALAEGAARRIAEVDRVRFVSPAALETLWARRDRINRARRGVALPERLELRIVDIVPDQRRPLVTTCADGFASTLAAATLDGPGYTGVRA